MTAYRRLLAAAILFAFCVVGLGAYVRLSDAGLGCPDWPGCYGHLVGVPDEPHEHAAAARAFPEQPVETGKAWKEMVHRYFAGTLGLLVLALTVLAWRRRSELGQSPLLPSLLLGITALQALLGMWTVTLLLKPVIVTAHLLGGMTTLSLLIWLWLRQSRTEAEPRPGPTLRIAGLAALAAVAAQIALGGWVSSNYAALACADFPTCGGAWIPADMDFRHAFQFRRELGQTADGALLNHGALTAIQWAHRVGALVVTLLTLGLAAALIRGPALRAAGLLLLSLLAIQVALGIANVLLSLPMAVAVAHNLGAALLLATTLTIAFRLWQPR
jgi:cytochrome c oxidase assembly protein subunit 15